MAGRLAPPERSAGADRLAGHDFRHGDPLVHRVGVHEPGHHLLVGAHIRRHHVDARPNEGDHLLHVAAGEVFELSHRQRVRIDCDAALAAAVRQIGERAFPAHPDRQRGDLADVDVRGESRAALGGTERQVVLDAVADEDPLAAVVHVDRAGDDDGALRIEEPVPVVLRNAQMIGDDMELLARHFEDGTRIKAFHGVLRGGRGAVKRSLAPQSGARDPYGLGARAARRNDDSGRRRPRRTA